jgi:hypothetical protein
MNANGGAENSIGLNKKCTRYSKDCSRTVDQVASEGGQAIFDARKHGLAYAQPLRCIALLKATQLSCYSQQFGVPEI